MRHWWVSQNQTYRHEISGGFLWSPKKRTDGARNYFYDTMQQVQSGDLVFSFCDAQIKAIGIVQKKAETAPNPFTFTNVGNNWSNTGWYVEVEFMELTNPIKPKSFMDQIRPLLPTKYSPLQANGNGLQQVYLAEISESLGDLLILLTKADFPSIAKELAPSTDVASEYEINLEIEAKQLEGDLEKIQISKSRRGQGIFKANVRLVEGCCRITGVTNIKHLRASHIKPWANSNDSEKLDGFNGLLLSPHVDHLFDRGFISFKDSGDLLVSQELNPFVLRQWAILPNQNVGNFQAHQKPYLEYHRNLIFKH